MKKILISFLCINFISYLTFASTTPDPSDKKTPEDLDNIVISELSNNNEKPDIKPEAILETSPEDLPSEKIEKKDNKNFEAVKTQEETSINTNKEPQNNKDYVKKDSEKKYPDLTDIEEPDIVTLEPKVKRTEDHVESELVVIDLPPMTDASAKAEEEKKAEPVKEEIVEEKVEEELPDLPAEKLPKPKKKDSILTEDVPQKIETISEEEITPNIDIITPSRSVSMRRLEYIDITYPGSGWIYIGIVDGSKDLAYFGRALGTKDTTFTLQAKVPGKKVLHFSKNDYLTGEYIDDYIEINILDEEGSNKTHIQAPEYKMVEKEPYFDTSDLDFTEDSVLRKESLEESHNEYSKTKQKNNSEKSVKYKEEPKDTSVLIPDSKPAYSMEEEYKQEESIDEFVEVTDLKTLLKEANFLYNEGEFEEAYNKVNKYLDLAVTNIDEALLLKGQILEARSELQDIKGAIEVYNKLKKDFPASKYWDEANKRIIYLKRFYLEVR